MIIEGVEVYRLHRGINLKHLSPAPFKVRPMGYITSAGPILEASIFGIMLR